MNQDFEDFMVGNMHEDAEPASGCGAGCLPMILVVALLLVATFLLFH